MQREDYPKNYEDWYFILLSKCNACGIEGEGRVDGQGSLWASGGCAPGPALHPACAVSTNSSYFWLRQYVICDMLWGGCGSDVRACTCWGAHVK